MALPAAQLKESERYFLGVGRSLTGRAWRDRLDARGSALALAIAQRHGLDELLGRVLAGRNVEVDNVEAFLDPTIKRLLPDPHTLTGMQAASARIADAVIRGEKTAIFGHYDVDGATAAAVLSRSLSCCGCALSVLEALLARSLHPHALPLLRMLWAKRVRDPVFRGARCKAAD